MLRPADCHVCVPPLETAEKLEFGHVEPPPTHGCGTCTADVTQTVQELHSNVQMSRDLFKGEDVSRKAWPSLRASSHIPLLRK